MRTPSTEGYDSRPPQPDRLHQPDQIVPDFKSALSLEKDYPSTHTRDKALLVALGVNGEVSFFDAAANAGLPVVGCERGVLFANRGSWVAANDNRRHAIAA
jgi:hypothetical protein